MLLTYYIRIFRSKCFLVMCCNILATHTCKIADLWPIITKWQLCLWAPVKCPCANSKQNKMFKRVTKCTPNCKKMCHFDPTMLNNHPKPVWEWSGLKWIKSDMFCQFGPHFWDTLACYFALSWHKGILKGLRNMAAILLLLVIGLWFYSCGKSWCYCTYTVKIVTGNFFCSKLEAFLWLYSFYWLTL